MQVSTSAPVSALECPALNTIPECGFRQNWLNISLYSPWSLRWGKKFSIINHIPEIRLPSGMKKQFIMLIHSHPAWTTMAMHHHADSQYQEEN